MAATHYLGTRIAAMDLATTAAADNEDGGGERERMYAWEGALDMSWAQVKMDEEGKLSTTHPPTHPTRNVCMGRGPGFEVGPGRDGRGG